MSYPCSSLSTMLRQEHLVSHHHHDRGWIETPDGRFFQPKASKVHFLPGLAKPFIAGIKRRRRWWARLMGISA
ncbi:phage filamentation protein Fil family protein [Limnobaculum xujianqingii]|uniref:phage filamentation protein Fil family protein n=1 Tax=Limnobaculum xujianqingii TaxID=2738837 RepID=UPI00112B7FB1|nr:phage filamentation protein Fil family protein [Limnobaculum xujianqingii]